MYVISELTGKEYQDEDAVFFRNLYQCAFYIKHNCMPIDMFCDGRDKLVMVFNRADHNRMIGKWMENKQRLEQSNE